MVQGAELSAKLNDVANIIYEYEQNFLKRAELESKVRHQVAEKVALDVSDTKGKVKVTGIAVGVYVLVMLLLATIAYGMIGAWVVVAVAGAIAYVNWNKKRVVSIAAGAVAALITIYLVYICVIEVVIRAFATGNVVGILITVIMALILVAIIYFGNRKSVQAANAKIRKTNEEIIASNNSLKLQADKLLNRAKQLDSALLSQVTPNGWYPAKYAFGDAVSFFVEYMRDVNPDVSMSVLIEKYEQEQRDRETRAFRNQVLSNQAAIIRNQQMMMAQYDRMIENLEYLGRQVQFSNMIGMYQCYQISVLNNNVSAIRQTQNMIVKRR